MLEGLRRVDETVVPFVSMFYSSPSGCLWEDSDGTTHTIVQGEGGEQGDPLMPLFAVQQQLREGEYLFAYLDDIYAVTEPNRTVVGLLENALWAGISMHQGKTKMWNRAGVEPPGCEICKIWNGCEQKPVHVRHVQRLTQSLRSTPQSCGIAMRSGAVEEGAERVVGKAQFPVHGRCWGFSVFPDGRFDRRSRRQAPLSRSHAMRHRVRVGEASHPGPAGSRYFALTEVESDVEDGQQQPHF